MRIALLAVPLVMSCDGVFKLVELDEPAPVDASIDASGVCYGVGGLLPPFCPDAGVQPTATLGTVTINTATCPLTLVQPEGPELCVFFVEQLELDALVRVIGPRPLVIVSAGPIWIQEDGEIDAGSSKIQGPGAGAAIDCVAPASGTDGSATSGGGGGAGGSFVSSGGAGGSGGTGVGGKPGAPFTPTHVRGGCRGGTGGTGASQGPIGGSGGGAVYLISGTSIHVDGTVNAFGAGGLGGGGAYQGGSGGGAGGLIGLDAPTIVVTASGRLIARGGGGGEGGSSTGGGMDGLWGRFAATGGQGTSDGGDGGDGSGLAGRSGQSVSPDAGGGGGGGGGFIGTYYSESLEIAPTAIVAPPRP